MFVPVCMHLKTMKLRANCNYIPIFRGSGRANFEKGGFIVPVLNVMVLSNTNY